MQNLKLPKHWNQISVSQFLEIRSLSGEDGMFNYQIDVLSALTDSNISDFEELDIDELGELTKQIKWVQSDPSRRYKTKLDNHVLKPFTKLTLGEFIDLEHYFSNNYLDHKACPGDLLIICAYGGLEEEELPAFKPRLADVDAPNRITHTRHAIPVQVA